MNVGPARWSVSRRRTARRSSRAAQEHVESCRPEETHCGHRPRPQARDEEMQGHDEELLAPPGKDVVRGARAPDARRTGKRDPDVARRFDYLDALRDRLRSSRRGCRSRKSFRDRVLHAFGQTPARALAGTRRIFPPERSKSSSTSTLIRGLDDGTCISGSSKTYVIPAGTSTSAAGAHK